MWKLVENNGRGGKLRTSFAVQRFGTIPGHAHIVIPGSAVVARRFDLFCDGNGGLALRISTNGAWALYRASLASRTFLAKIPARFTDIISRIPMGTTDIETTRDGDLIVLDLSKLGPEAGDA